MKHVLKLLTALLALSAVLSGCGAASTTTVPAQPASTATTPAADKPAEATFAASTSAPTTARHNGIIKIVSSLPMDETQDVNAIRQRFEEANYLACNGKYKLVYESLSDTTAPDADWDAKLVAQNANQAAADPDVMIYLGPRDSGAVKIAIPILNRAGVAMISYSATWPGLTKPDKGNLGEPDVYYPTGTRNFARTTPADDIQGFVGANWAKELGVKRAYILHGDSVYGKGLADIFRTQVKKLGIEVVGDVLIDVEAKDYIELAKTIKVAAPDLVYFGGLLEDHPDLVLHDLQAAGYGGKFMGGDGIYDDALITEAGEAAEGVYITFGGVPPEQLTGKGKQWFDSYVEKFKTQPESSTSLAYETAAVALAAINKACQKDRTAIREALFATKAYDGLFGSWSFNENGDTSLTTMSGLQVERGKFEFVKLLTSQ